MAARLGRVEGTAQGKSDNRFPARALAAIVATVGLALADATPNPSTEPQDLVQAASAAASGSDPLPEQTAKDRQPLPQRC